MITHQLPIFIAFIFAAVIPNCGGQADDAQAERIGKLSVKVAELDQKVADQSLELEKLRSEKADRSLVYQKIFSLSDSIVPDEVTLSPAATVNLPVRTNFGSLLISIKNVKPYGDGYKVVINVGNPYFVKISNPTLNTTWYPNLPDGKINFSRTGSHANETKSEVNIRPGSWTPVTLILTPATKDEIANIAVKISLTSVSLKQSLAQPP